MSREVRRVAIDFEWPIKKLWIGYINPYKSMECPFCGGCGLNDETKKLQDSWYSSEDCEYVEIGNGRRYNKKAWSNNLNQEDVNALVKEGRLTDLTHTWTKDSGWKKKEPEYIPTAKEVNEWNINSIMGHDGISSYVCVKAKATRLGFYGECEKCKGDGYLFINDKVKKLHEEWENCEPPKGEGWQMWETTSEGSPISPVFETPEKLAKWLSDNNASTFGSSTTSYENWLSMIKSTGYAPSLLTCGNKLISGVDAIAQNSK